MTTVTATQLTYFGGYRTVLSRPFVRCELVGSGHLDAGRLDTIGLGRLDARVYVRMGTHFVGRAW